MKIKNFFSIVFSLYCYSLPLCAEDDSIYQECCPWIKSKWLGFHYLAGKGIGFNKGYTTAELFLSTSTPKCDWIVPFVDLRGHYINGGNYAFNGGIGSRFLISDGCRALGCNVYYDYRHTQRKNYNQIGAGFEFLNPQWELRANGYFPVGRKKTKAFSSQFDYFSGNSFFIRSKYQFAFTGGNAEVGWHFYEWGKFDLFAAAGPYYFKGDIGKAAIGGQARCAIRYGQYASIEVSDSYDQVFHNRAQGLFSINIPFGPKAKSPRQTCNCCCSDQILLQEWLYDAPKRQELVVIDTKKETTEAIDPATGQPYHIIFVNNTSSSNGTFESPYPTLAAAEAASTPGNVIYVFPGDGTTNGMNTGITLQNGQRFLGSGVAHPFNTQFGSIEIPAQTSNLPKITNVGTIVTLINNNEVSGFAMTGGNPSISGAFTGMSGNININNNQITGSLGTAISVDPTNSSLNVLVDSNTITYATGISVDCSYTNSTGTATVQNNTISYGTGVAINMSNSGSTVTDNVLHNTVNNVNSHPIFIVANNLSIVNSVTSGNTIYDIFNSTISPPPPFGLILESENGSEHIVQFNDNQVNTGYGSILTGVLAIVTGTNPTALILNIFNNEITGAAAGLVVQSNAGCPGTIEGAIFNNLIENSLPSQEFGVFSYTAGALTLAAEGNGLMNISMYGNFINDSGASTEGLGLSIFGSTGATGTVNLSCSRNIFAQCDGSAINLTDTGFAGRMILDFDTNTIKENGTIAGLPATFFLNPTSGFYEIFVNSNVLLLNRHRSFNFTPTTGNVFAFLSLTNNIASDPLVVNNMNDATIFLIEPSNNTLGTSLFGPITIIPGTPGAQ